jgi:hypothetical protein
MYVGETAVRDRYVGSFQVHMAMDFALLAGQTGTGKGSHQGGQAWPTKLGRDQMSSGFDPRMVKVMQVVKNLLPEGCQDECAQKSLCTKTKTTGRPTPRGNGLPVSTRKRWA